MNISVQVYALISTFLLSLIAGPILIPILTKLKFGQVISTWGPKSHLSKKGTPTMGGLIFLIPLTIVGLFFSGKYPMILPLVLVTLGFGLVGFIDDFIIVIKKRAVGLKPGQKMLGLIAVAVIFTLYIANHPEFDTTVLIPFINYELVLPVWLFIPFCVFVLISYTNAVNLTDGLDGLAGGVTFIVSVFFTLVGMAYEPYQDVMIFAACLTGGCLGFLAYNIHPARVFMGDTGSLALGGAISAIAIMMKMEFVLLIAGGIYFIEALSVVIQVASFKLTGKRVFKMTPIHHHFELSGWKETRIVWTFWAVTVVLCFIGLLSLRIRII